MAIEVVLSYDNQPVIKLTERMILKANFITAKTHKFNRQTKDITLSLKFENSTVRHRPTSSRSVGNKNEDETVTEPNEIDSVRNLLVFAISSYRKQFAYLDGEIKITNEFGQVVKTNFKNLFVLKYTEQYTKDTRNTIINILIREKARQTHVPNH